MKRGKQEQGLRRQTCKIKANFRVTEGWGLEFVKTEGSHTGRLHGKMLNLQEDVKSPTHLWTDLISADDEEIPRLLSQIKVDTLSEMIVTLDIQISNMESDLQAHKDLLHQIKQYQSVEQQTEKQQH